MDSTAQALMLLSQWISFLFQAVPCRIAPTLLELLMGCMVCRGGHISSALLAVRPQLSWTAYYKAIEKGRFQWLALARQWMRLILKRIPNRSIEFAIDDFPLPRSSKKAPCAGWHYDHAHRPNRPKFLWGCQAPSFWSRSYESFIMTRGFPSPALGASTPPRSARLRRGPKGSPRTGPGSCNSMHCAVFPRYRLSAIWRPESALP